MYAQGCWQTQLHSFAIFEGKWQLENSNTYEEWYVHNNSLTGQVIKIENTDTLIVEKLRIFSEGNEMYYEATVPSQNQGKAIRFKLTKQNNNSFTFENPNHDFPQKIEYRFKNKTTLNAIISGGSKRVSFNYNKID